MNHSEQRIALVTGAGQGLGEAISLRLARDGQHVVVTDIDEEKAETVAAAIRADGGSANARRTDVSDVDEVEATVLGIDQEFGRLDVLVSNAGLLRDNLLFRMTNEDWYTVINTHLTGSFFCARAAQRLMVREKYGKIVFVSSRASMGNRGQANYSAAKAGLLGMARTLALELGPFGINVNAVAPGHIETPMTHATAARMGVDYESLAKSVIDRNAIKRVGQPNDVASAVAFLASEDAAYVTGQVLYLTGRPLQ